jgi:hypothetical protein
MGLEEVCRLRYQGVCLNIIGVLDVVMLYWTVMSDEQVISKCDFGSSLSSSHASVQQDCSVYPFILSSVRVVNS